MDIEITKISPEQKEQILNVSEGHFEEIKSIEIAPAKLSRTLSAFANSAGGELYIGIDELNKRFKKIRKWRGFIDPEAANAHIQVFEELFPLGGDFSYTFLSCIDSEGLVLKAEIHKTSDIKKATDGIPYLRRSAQNLPVDTPEKQRRLELDKGIVSFENEVVSIDPRLIENSAELLKFLLEVVPSAEPEPWLKKQLLFKEGKPTVASILLFSEEPQAILPKRCGVKIYQYHTQDETGSRKTMEGEPLTIEGCLYNLIRGSVSKTVEMVENVPVLKAGKLEMFKYPDITLHEIITNAVLHRDYSIPSDIQIRIFDNRIEIESPGKFAGHITEQNVLHEQFARNGKLVRLINKFPNPPNKDVGEGLSSAFAAMREHKLKPPEIKEKENSVIVYIKHEPLASPEEAVLQFLESNPEISNTQGREITGIVSENSMKRVFYRLRDQKLIERVPNKFGSSSVWQKTGKIPKNKESQPLLFTFED